MVKDSIRYKELNIYQEFAPLCHRWGLSSFLWPFSVSPVTMSTSKVSERFALLLHCFVPHCSRGIHLSPSRGYWDPLHWAISCGTVPVSVYNPNWVSNLYVILFVIEVFSPLIKVQLIKVVKVQ